MPFVDADARRGAASPGAPSIAQDSATVGYAPEILVLFGLAANLFVALSARHFPYHDAVNHLGRWVLMAEVWSHRAPAWAHVRLLVFPSPYLGADLIGVLLVRMFGAGTGFRLVSALTIASLPVGMYALLRVVAPRRRGWALIGVLFAFCYFMLIGNLADVLGAGLALAWLAFWWPRRARPQKGTLVLLALWLIVLYLFHLSAPLTVLTVVWMDYALAVWQRWTGVERTWRVFLDSRLATLAVVTTVIASLIILWTATSSKGLAGDPLIWGRFADKAKNAFTPFYALTQTQMWVMTFGYGISLLTFLFADRAYVRPDTFTCSAIAFFVLFLVFPSKLGPNTGMIDTRWLLPAYLLPFCASWPSQHRRENKLLGVPFTAVMAHAIVIALLARRIDRQLDAYDAVLERIPSGARILPIDADPSPNRRVIPYHHYAIWHTVRHHGQVAGLFAYSNDIGTYENIRHLWLSGPTLKRVPDYWAVGGRFDYDWPSIDRQYDYIVLGGADPRASDYLRAHARELVRIGDVTLYKTRRSTWGS